tara:strand:+ start:650 stop:1573 length:924 start_codon:yes stop_codon:yes gene_type:complete
MNNKFAIEVKNLSKIFIKDNQKINALKNFSINIPKGCIYGLLGPNGAGKSTFINILSGIVKKTQGTVNIEGINQDNNAIATRKKIGIVPQELNIDPFFTPFELLELQAGLYGIRKKNRRTEKILHDLGLSDQRNAYARTLSGGMRRRLLIAKALVHNPDVIVLDEPTAGVDVELRRNLWKYVGELKRMGKTICLTTHYLEEAEKMCDLITIINKGIKIIEDKKDNLLNLFSNRKVKFDIISKNVSMPEKLKPLIYNYDGEDTLILEYNKKEISLSEIIKELDKNKIIFSEIKTYDEDLESIFLKITK